MTTYVAYCWASGEIHIALERDDFNLPDGTILFARGEGCALGQILNETTGVGPDDECYVPGLQRLGDDSEQAVEIFERWVDWAFENWPLVDGVRTQSVAGA